MSGITNGITNWFVIENSELTGTVINFFILIITFIIALLQLKIETNILTNILLILIASLSLALAIFFGLGSKEIIKNILAGVYLNKTLQEGESIKTQNTEGKILQIWSILTSIETTKQTLANSLIYLNCFI